MSTTIPKRYDAVVIGGGFGGLSVAYELAKAGKSVIVLEADDAVGGLAGSFEVGGTRLEKFYHHWFTNDVAILNLVRELGLEDQMVYRPTRTGMYYANSFYRLSTPLDLLKFGPVSFPDRIRLGLLTLRARKVDDWRPLEDISASDWLRSMGGNAAYKTVWEPMLVGKFGPYAEDVSAVWIWNKLKLRGGSRSGKGAEVLAYYKGGFAALSEGEAAAVEKYGGVIKTGCPVIGIVVKDGVATGVQTPEGTIEADCVVSTLPLPTFADLVEPSAPKQYVDELRKIKFLANVCLVLELDRSLSDTYWLNVADPNFPFVGIIEHTNFEPTSTYAGKHIVYLSKYLTEDSELYRLKDSEVLDYALPHIKKMFPNFDRTWVSADHVWRARFSQPIVTKHYSRDIPSVDTPIRDLYLCTMAQIYPEDRGTNYAIRQGREVGHHVLQQLGDRATATAR